MASTSTTSPVSNQNLEIPPLRSLDDFLLGSARFQLPNLNDLEKWGNRVVKNLLYYQTNYFLMFAAIYALMAILNPTKIFAGLFVKAMIVAIYLHFFTDKGSNAGLTTGNSYQKWYFLVGTLGIGYLLLYWYEALLLSAFTLLLPFCATFVHSSLRLRNIRNKVANAMDSFGSGTPMGLFLSSMDITVENILS